ncbi:hypothetical protein NADE_008161 [Nannochloris sp. 'desiccata']|nr:hypothetical protein NADE_008161 [Chlorella desiccata (nom. nud.)]
MQLGGELLEVMLRLDQMIPEIKKTLHEEDIEEADQVHEPRRIDIYGTIPVAASAAAAVAAQATTAAAPPRQCLEPDRRAQLRLQQCDGTTLINTARAALQEEGQDGVHYTILVTKMGRFRGTMIRKITIAAAKATMDTRNLDSNSLRTLKNAAKAYIDSANWEIRSNGYKHESTKKEIEESLTAWQASEYKVAYESGRIPDEWKTQWNLGGDSRVDEENNENNGAFTDDRAAREAAVGEVDGSDESESEEDNEQEGRRSRRTRRLVVRV